jgi:hypothetical protein
MKTFNDIERAAYMSGNIELSNLAFDAQTLWDVEDSIGGDFKIDFTLDTQIDAKIDSEVGKRCPNYAEYKQFFEDCFYRLNGHYPAPSVTSDYDQSVIFDAIEKGSK